MRCMNLCEAPSVMHPVLDSHSHVVICMLTCSSCGVHYEVTCMLTCSPWGAQVLQLQKRVAEAQRKRTTTRYS